MSSAAIALEVFDPTGTPVADADVILSEPSRKQKLYGKTDKHGRFVLAGVRSGRYVLTVSAPGLRSLPQTLDMRSGEKLSLPVKLNFEAMMGDVVIIEPEAKPSRDSLLPAAPLPATGGGPRPMQH